MCWTMTSASTRWCRCSKAQYDRSPLSCVVQVQQFLTDASATGERDGLKDASEHFQALGKNLRAIAEFDTAFAAKPTK